MSEIEEKLLAMERHISVFNHPFADTIRKLIPTLRRCMEQRNEYVNVFDEHSESRMRVLDAELLKLLLPEKEAPKHE